MPFSSNAILAIAFFGICLFLFIAKMRYSTFLEQERARARAALGIADIYKYTPLEGLDEYASARLIGRWSLTTFAVLLIFAVLAHIVEGDTLVRWLSIAAAILAFGFTCAYTFLAHRHWRQVREYIQRLNHTTY